MGSFQRERIREESRADDCRETLDSVKDRKGKGEREERETESGEGKVLFVRSGLRHAAAWGSHKDVCHGGERKK